MDNISIWNHVSYHMFDSYARSLVIHSPWIGFWLRMQEASFPVLGDCIQRWRRQTGYSIHSFST
jgi:hypothetical protein